jgi:hypothetical protein
MSGLRERDVRSALDLVYDAGMLTCPEPFPREFLERLTRLIPADVIVGYHEAVIGAPCRTVEVMEIPPDPIPAEVEEAARHIFRQEPFLHGRYRSERRALKTSDVVTRRRFRQRSGTHRSGSRSASMTASGSGCLRRSGGHG